MSSHNLHSLLQTTFGFPAFRVNQEAVCEASAAGRDVLLVMPTGAGKSLCYQLPALARGGTALVISPLIALMDDQAQKLSALGLRVGRIHSGLDREQSRQVCREFLDGKLQFLFIAPERLKVPGFVEMLRKGKLALIAVDEAHCISQWGHDFRPDYRNLARHIETLRPTPVIALTATATPQVQRDIVSELRLQDAAQFIHGFRRTNLAVEVVEVSKPRRKEMARKLLAEASSRPAIVYAPSRKDADELATQLNEHFPARAYHAGLTPAMRDAVQGDFLRGKLQVVVATVAFGMGIDKADVRTVLHVAMPASVESYYQEIGRAGRDGSASRAVLMYSYQDRRMHDFFLERDYPPVDTLGRIAGKLNGQPVHADDLRIALKLDMESFGPALDKLLAQGAAEIDYAGNVTATGSTRSEWRASYEAQVSFRRGQIDAMMRYAGGAECRMLALIRHFGDRSDGSRTCGLCDFCSPERAVAQPFREPTREEEREMRRVLRELSKSAARPTGKLYAELFPKGQIDRKEFDGLLDGLSRAGYVTIEAATFTSPEDGREIAFRKAAITHEGREIEEGEALVGVQLRDAEMANAGRPGRSSAGAEKSRSSVKKAKAAEEDLEPLTEAQKRMEGALRAWRLSVATELKQPAFCVFGDRVLRSLVRETPGTPEELLGISGLGKVKVEKWGAAICGVLADPGSFPEANELTGALRKKTVEGKQDRLAARGSDIQEGLEAGRPLGERTAPRESFTPVFRVVPPAVPGDDALSLSLEHALKVWRMRAAKGLGVAPFVLLLDGVLRAIVRAMPKSMAELGAVEGISAEWIRVHGAAVLEAVRRYSDSSVEPTAAAARVLRWPEIGDSSV